MSTFAIHNVFYRPGTEVVTIAVQSVDGPFRGKVIDLYTTQSALAARGREVWGDEEVAAEAAAQLEAQDAVLQPL